MSRWGFHHNVFKCPLFILLVLLSHCIETKAPAHSFPFTKQCCCRSPTKYRAIDSRCRVTLRSSWLLSAPRCIVATNHVTRLPVTISITWSSASFRRGTEKARVGTNRSESLFLVAMAGTLPHAVLWRRYKIHPIPTLKICFLSHRAKQQNISNIATFVALAVARLLKIN